MRRGSVIGSLPRATGSRPGGRVDAPAAARVNPADTGRVGSGDGTAAVRHSRDRRLGHRGPPTRPQRLEPRRALGPGGRHVPVRVMAPWRHLPAAVRPLTRRALADVLRPQGERSVGAGCGLHRGFPTAVAHGACRLGTGGTWTRGLAFVPRGTAAYPAGPPDSGALELLLQRYALDHRRPASFAVERSRGWTETADSPPQGADDPWDEKRIKLLTMEKARPGRLSLALRVRGWHAAHRGGQPGAGPARYSLVGASGRESPLAGVQWADWASDGRLLVATTAGELQVRVGPDAAGITWRHDLAPLTPDPVPPPPAAHEW